MTKDEIRQQIAELRPNFQTLEKLSAVIVEKFQGLETFQNAKTVGAYMPLPDEVNITPLFHPPSPEGSGVTGCLETNCVGAQKFYIPAFDETSGGYRLAEYSSELKKGNFGILEPKKPVFAPKMLDLILIPGVAFDQNGGRIGRGGGFYDRLLPQYRALKVGICFDFQCLETVPSESHDCTVDCLVTEFKILDFAMNS